MTCCPHCGRMVPPLDTVDLIQREVAEVFNVSLSRMLGPCRKARYVRARFAAVLLAAEDPALSYPFLGRKFRRHHTSVMNAFERAKSMLATDPDFVRLVARAGARVRAAREMPRPAGVEAAA